MRAFVLAFSLAHSTATDEGRGVTPMRIRLSPCRPRPWLRGPSRRPSSTATRPPASPRKAAPVPVSRRHRLPPACPVAAGRASRAVDRRGGPFSILVSVSFHGPPRLSSRRPPALPPRCSPRPTTQQARDRAPTQGPLQHETGPDHDTGPSSSDGPVSG